MAVPPVDAARALAGLVVVRQNLTPPVAIQELLELYADVERVDWPTTEVDAVMLRRPSARPQVFFRSSDNRGRERFTLAHELGHILLSWHLGNAACTPSAGAFDVLTSSEEDQADAFASCLLAPDQWLRKLVDRQRGDMSALLAELETAELSTTASLLALRRALMAGWAFQLNNQVSLFTTPGTGELPKTPGPFAPTGTQRRAELDAVAHEQGTVALAGNTVRWWRLGPASPLPDEDRDDRTDTELLRAAIAACVADADRRQHLLQSLNGKVGGGANNAAGRDPASIYEGLWHRIEADGRFEAIMRRPEFPIWLARKSRRRHAAGESK